MRQTHTGDRGSAAARTGPAVAYFAKAPRPGAVKTRLCPPLTPAEAAGLYRGFLSDLLVPIAGARTLVYGWPDLDLDEIRALAPAGVEVRAQRGDDLWARVGECFRELFGEGHDRVLIRNTDSPDLPAERVPAGLAAAAPGRVVLGPDRGGGYYLIALAEPHPELFAGLEDGAPTVLEATIARAEELALDLHLLPLESDVDTFDDLLALWRRRSRKRV